MSKQRRKSKVVRRDIAFIHEARTSRRSFWYSIGGYEYLQEARAAWREAKKNGWPDHRHRIIRRTYQQLELDVT